MTASAALAAGVARELMAAEDGAEKEVRRAADSYRIQPKESAASAIVRIARGRLDRARERLTGGLEEDPAAVVHETRKDVKKTRALLRLVRDQLGKDLYARQNDRLRAAARALSGTRDATVRIGTLEALAERFGDELPAWSKELGEALEEEERALRSGSDGGDSHVKEAASRAAALIAEVREEVDEWSFSKSGFKLLAEGLDRTYRRGRKRFADVRSDPTPENVHEWRKRIKDLWYALRLLHDTWPAILGEMADQAHALSDLLGDHHDLTVLSEELDRRSDQNADERAALQALIESRQEELLEAAVPIGERLYAESPKVFVERLRAYWRARDRH